MRKRIGLVFVIIAILLMMFSLYSCKGEEFTVTFEGNGGSLVSGVETQLVKEGDSVTPPAYERAGYTLSWGDFSFDAIAESVTVKAVWTPIVYTITYVLDGGTNHADNPSTYTVESPSITLKAPTKATRVFAGFTEGNTLPAKSTGNKTFTATWTAAKYTYTFFDENGATVLKTATVDYGSAIEPPTTPTKNATEQYSHTFTGWDKEIPQTLTANITFTATFSQTVNQYTYTFFDEDGATVRKTATADYGSAIVPPTTPTKTDTAQYSYTFTGWGKAIPQTLTANITFTAVFSQTVNQYTYTFFDEDGATVRKTATVDYGSAIVPPTNPTKNATAQYSYTFTGWGKEIPQTLTANINFTAVFSQTVNQYTYTFFDEDGTTALKTATVDYGSAIVPPTNPTKSATAQYTFTFISWDNEIPAALTEDITFIAEYSAEINSYTASFLTDGGDEVPDFTAEYGAKVQMPATAPTKADTFFLEWCEDAEGNFVYDFDWALTSDITLYAHWAELSFYPLPDYTEYEVYGIGDFVDSETIVIPSTYRGLPVVGIGQYSLSANETLLQVTINEGIKYIGSGAFCDCENLTSVTLPSSLETIASIAFGYTALESIVIPNNITAISDNLFLDCTNLVSATLPSGLQTIGEYAFESSGLESITIPDSVVTVGTNAFRYCSSLASATIGATTLSYGVFWDCGNLETVTLSYGLESIGDYAFVNCKKLSSIVLPSSLTFIDESAFSSTGLTEITIPGSIKSLGESSFSHNYSLASVTFEYGIESIGYNAFYASNLTSVVLPDSIKTLEERAFTHSANLSTVVIGSGIESIGKSAFGSGGMRTVTIKAAVPPSIGEAVFGHGATSVYVPAASVDQYKSATAFSLYSERIKAMPGVTFDTKGGSDVASIIDLVFGVTIEAPEAPEKDHNTFDGWFVEEACLTAYNFDTPVTESIILYAKWIVDQVSYTFYDDDATTVIKIETADYGSQIFPPTAPTKEATAQYTYTFTGWDKAIPATLTEYITFTATYSQTVNQYSYTFFDDDETTVLKTATVDYGSAIEPPTNPTKTDTAQYSYTFTGWDKAIPATLIEDITFTATYSQTVNQYVYTFFDDDITTVLKTATVDYGSLIEPPSEPTKAATLQYTYTFSGWDKAIPATLIEDITFTATYSQTVNPYTYTFFDDDETTVLKTATVDYGSLIVPPSEPTKAATLQYTYTFSGWDKEIPSTLTEGITFIAIYSETINQYIYAFYDADGTLLKSALMDYGTKILPPTAPTKEATPQYTYTFSSWNQEIPATLTEDIYFMAEYTQTVNRYVYTFFDDDITTVLKTATVDYGSEIEPPTNPTKSATAQYTFTFISWDNEIPAALTEDITFIAIYSETINQYTYAFYDADGTLLKSALMDYGSEIVPPEDPIKAATAQYTYTFTGWDNAIPAELTANIDFTAQFSQEPVDYSITFDSNGGSVVDPIVRGYNSFLTDLDSLLVRDGHIFSGWYLDNRTFQNPVPAQMPAESISLYAKWTARERGVIFDANGGSGTMPTQMISIGSTATLNSNTFTQTGFYFAGWATSASDEAEYADRDAYFMGLNSSTLYATWQPWTDISQFEFSYFGDSYYLYKYNGSATTVAIPGEYNGYPVIGISQRAFEYNTSIQTVIFPNTIQIIELFAFESCSGLTSLSLPEGLLSIAENAFSNCANIVELYLPSTLTSIGRRAFKLCSGLRSITIPDSVTYLAANSFEKTGATSAVVGSGVEDIPDGVFASSSSLSVVSMRRVAPPSLFWAAFYGCPLTAIYVPAGSVNAYKAKGEWNHANYINKIFDIGSSQFTVNFDLGESTTVSVAASAGCTMTAPTTPIISGKSFAGWYKEAEHINLWNFDTDCVLADTTLYAKWLIPVTFDTLGGSSVPSLDVEIGDYLSLPSAPEKSGYSFDNWYKEVDCINVWDFNTDTVATGATLYAKWILISGTDGLAYTLINDNTEYEVIGYSGVSSDVIIPLSYNGLPVTRIEEYAFTENATIQTLEIFGVAEIAKSALLRCPNLVWVSFGDNLEYIGRSAFDSCPLLMSVTIPLSVTFVDSDAFYDDSGKTITIYCEAASQPESWHPYWPPTDLVLVWNSDGIERTFSFDTFGGSAVAPITDFNILSIPIAEKDGYYFNGWYDNEDCLGQPIQFPYFSKTVSMLYARWMVEQPGGPATEGLIYALIEGGTQYRVTGYIGTSEAVFIPSLYNGFPVTEILYSSFVNNNTITEVIIGNGITKIGDSAFSHCTKLSSIVIGTGVTSIGRGAFYYCSSLTSVIIPEGVATIIESTFEGCTSLASVVLPTTVTRIENYAFCGCSITSLVIPKNVADIGYVAFSCSSLTTVIVEAEIPPSLNSTAFQNPDLIQFFVPASSVDEYKAAQGWSAFANSISAIE